VTDHLRRALCTQYLKDCFVILRQVDGAELGCEAQTMADVL